jgi:hypothetical protein
VLFTAAVLAVYRLGSWIPAPGVDQKALQSLFSGGGSLTLLNLFSGSALSRFSIFARGLAEIACTRTVSFFDSSPSPRSLTSVLVFLIRRFSTSDSGVTSSPASKRSRSRRFTGTV